MNTDEHKGRADMDPAPEVRGPVCGWAGLSSPASAVATRAAPPLTCARSSIASWVIRHSSFVIACSLAVAFTLRAGDWPQWRGPNRDGHLVGETLPAELPAQPKALFRVPVADGFAGPAVAAGKLVVLDSHGGQETAHGFDAKTGHELWSTPLGELYTDEFGSGSRCTPLIDGDRVYVQSCMGEFRCLGLADGATRWRFHFHDYGMTWIPDKNGGGGAASRRGYSGSAVIDGDRIFIQIGSANGACLGAFDKVTGKLLWKSQNDLVSYASLSLGTLAGRRQVISATCEGLLAVDVNDGAVLWRQPFKTRANRNVVTPLIDGDDVLFAACSIPLNRQRIVREGDTLHPVGQWTNRTLNINLVTPTIAGEYLYGIGGEKSGRYVCVDRRTGEIAWSQPGFGEVASAITDGERLLVLTDAGECLLLAADPKRYHELGRFQAVGKNFAHPALVNGILFARDSRELAAYELKSRLP